jgi:hypothetical protein
MIKILGILVLFTLVGCRPCETCSQSNGGFVEACTTQQYSHDGRCYDHIGYVYHYRYYIGQGDVETNQVPKYLTEFPERTLLRSLQECDDVKQATRDSLESNSKGVLGTGRFTYTILSESCDPYYFN